MSAVIDTRTQEPVASAPATAEVVLDVRGLTRHYGSFQAVRGISFQVRAGQIFGFVGPNGAGKTTSLRILATLDAATSGDAVIGGHSVTDHPERVRPLVGYMPDRSGIYDDTTVFEYLDFFARAYGLKGRERRERVESVMEFTQLLELREKLLTTLSKGMKQRAALGRTLLNDPKLLILDEPADGLDPRARIELRELLKALAAQGKAILISSHILTELSEMCDACAIIEQGALLASGNVAEIVGQDGRRRAELEIRLVRGADLEQHAAACERFLLEQPGVHDLKGNAGVLRLSFEGDEAQASALLKALIVAGHPIASFQTRVANLEDAFMSVTKGRVQ
jgi:ABC-2 type transport system ATP-binding protein